MVCTVTGTLHDLTGSTLPNQKITFRREIGVVAQDSVTVVPATDVEVTADASGNISVDLYPGTYIAFTNGYDGSLRFSVGVPDAASAVLRDIINQLPAITPSVLSQAVDAKNKAEEWATNPEDDPVETSPDKYSALHWAAKAEAFVATLDGVNWTGDWATATAYDEYDAVANDGSSYVCIVAHTSGSTTEPGVGASWETYWDVLAEKGDTGATGPKGDTGDTGPQGPQGDPGLDVSWESVWATSTGYAVNDAVENDGSSYICTQAHTSGSSTEPGVGGSWASYWDLMAAKGADGAGTGDMLASTYDPQSIASDAFARANHTGTQTLATISDAGTAASLDVPSTGDAAVGEVVKGDDTRLSDDRTPTAHTHTLSDITDSGTAAGKDAGVAGGVADLDGSGRVPAAQLPSYVDDVEEYADFASFPATGETGKLYVDLAEGDIYRWSGSAYVQINDAVSSADQATKLATARTISVSGKVTGSVSFDGSANVDIATSVGTFNIADLSDWPASVSVTEVGYLDGVTAPIQTQLDAAAVEPAVAMPADDIDMANGGYQTRTLTADAALTESLSNGESVIIRLSGGGTYDVTSWPVSATDWLEGSTPTLTADDLILIWKENTTAHGAYLGSFA